MGAPAYNIKRIFASIACRYDVANLVLSLGLSFFWRWQVLRAIGRSMPSGIRIQAGRALDLCTGTGALLKGLNRCFSQVVGVDFCWPMLEIANRRGKREHYASCQLVLGDALCLPFPDWAFDVVTVAYGVRNFSDLQRGLSEMRRVLKKDGRVFVLEFSQPTWRVWRRVFSFYFRYLVPFVGKLVTGEKEPYCYLHESVAAFFSKGEFAEFLKQAGFTGVECRALSGGMAYLWSAAKG